MTYEEHIAWCKKRALQYLDDGDVKNAITSMLSDLRKRDGLHEASALSMLGMSYAINNDAEGARRFIEGFR